jgi:two-component system C4-dicarboxylate transport sensor histidine kinase DctB|tara:strand:- start:319 stop:2040 length:1722 start_codon:yes stop_codon:yes gene_type:complete
MSVDRRKNPWGILAYLVTVALFVSGVWWYGYVVALGQLERRAQSDLMLAADSLTAELRRYRELAVLTADRPQLSAVLAGSGRVEAVRPILQQVSDKTGALDIVLLDTAGVPLIGTQDAPAFSHVGQSYFERAMDGALGVDHPVRDGVRTFVFAAPVFSDAGPVIGALLVYAGVGGVEDSWRGARPVLFFTDADGIVFVSNRSELVLRSRAPGDFLNYTARDLRGMDVWSVSGSRYVPRRALHRTMDLPVIGMHGEVLLDVAPARQIALLQSAVAGALCLAFGALLFLATQRRRTLAEANAKLEHRVQDRTAQLSSANLSLRQEVEDRRVAEVQLTKAQADLVQAGKLSALGQMSAGISHELNQPLMAIQSFAENGQSFMERDRPDMAAKNLGKISELAHRMGRIIRNLRAFARQESEPLGDVDVGRVVDTVLELLGPKIAEAQVDVRWDGADGVIVRGGDVRLQQVVLNLASNGIDAMELSDPRVLTITVAADATRVTLSVRDTGPGITEPEKIFDPFYSTKAIGAAEGMGLGLSISYGLVQSFGGVIRGRNHDAGGAIFTVELIPAAADKAV